MFLQQYQMLQGRIMIMPLYQILIIQNQKLNIFLKIPKISGKQNNIVNTTPNIPAVLALLKNADNIYVNVESVTPYKKNNKKIKNAFV